MGHKFIDKGSEGIPGDLPTPHMLVYLKKVLWSILMFRVVSSYRRNPHNMGAGRFVYNRYRCHGHPFGCVMMCFPQKVHRLPGPKFGRHADSSLHARLELCLELAVSLRLGEEQRVQR